MQWQVSLGDRRKKTQTERRQCEDRLGLCGHSQGALGRADDGPPSGAFGGREALPTPWLQASGLQNCERPNLCCFNPRSFWEFVAAALGNQYRGAVYSQGRSPETGQTSPVTHCSTSPPSSGWQSLLGGSYLDRSHPSGQQFCPSIKM